VTRRSVLGTTTAVALTVLTDRVATAAAPARTPVLFVSHGSPRLPIDPVRREELRAWGATLPRPRAILAMTPHFGVRRLELGATGRGFGMYNMPDWMRQKLPSGLDYPSPPSEALAIRVEELLSGVEPIARSGRPGFDHTVWMPLYYLYPPADVPVLEISYPYRTDRELWTLGRRLAPLRDEGVLIVASGQLTHNLAALAFGENVPVPGWSREFDAWGAEALRRQDIDAILDWRRKAPAAEIAHPDDGGHFRMVVFALGALVGQAGQGGRVTFPVQGFEGTMSKRGVEFTDA
jgi:4,5-DOPA dioxygenase extradiol